MRYLPLTLGLISVVAVCFLGGPSASADEPGRMWPGANYPGDPCCPCPCPCPPRARGAGRMEPASPLIPRTVLFGNPDRAGVRVSPDGARISFIAPVDGVMNIWVGPRDDPGQAKPVTRATKRGIRRYSWAHDNRHLIYRQDSKGDENWRVYALDLSSGETRDLTPFDGVSARIDRVSPEHPGHILVEINNRVPQLHDLHRVELATGKMTLVKENEGFIGFLTDHDMKVRMAARMLPTGNIAYLRLKDDGSWAPFMEVPTRDVMTTGPVGFTRDGKTLYLRDSRSRNTAALKKVNWTTGAMEVVAEDDRADIGQTIKDPKTGHVQAYAVNYMRVEWKLLDQSLAPDVAYLRTLDRGALTPVARSSDDMWWIVAFMHDNRPLRYYLYDRANRKARFLFTNHTALEPLRLASMNPVVIRSRDGLEMVSYLTLPVGSAPRGSIRPQRPLPMVLLVHGGPWSRDDWGYNPLHQWLANRGYAVLSVNFRGSSGFGKAFLNAATREWGGKMHDDLLDAVQWAVGRRIADPQRVAIMGGSYGGYATLVGMTKTPDYFACGIDIVGPSSLVTLIESVPPYWKPMMELWTTRVGDPRTEEGRAFLLERSPLTHVANIKKPLLIGQGKNDPRVKEAEATQIVEAMQERNIPVTYVLYPDEGHGFSRPPNRFSFNAIAEAFLAKVLGGRAEPIGDALEDSSLQVPAGAADIPGLVEAMERRKAAEVPAGQTD